MKAIAAAIVSFALFVASTNFAHAQGTPPPNDSTAATASAPATGANHHAHSHHKKKSLGQRMKSSVQKKLGKLTSRKQSGEHKSRASGAGKSVPESQVE